MATETWRRGVLARPVMQFRYRWKNTGTWTAWQRTTGNPNRDGFSYLVTSVRGSVNHEELKEIRKVKNKRLRDEYLARWRRHNVRGRGPLLAPNPFFISKREARWHTQDAATVKVGGNLYAWNLVELKGDLAAYSQLNEVTALVLPTVPKGHQTAVDSMLYQKASAPEFDGYTQLGELTETVAMLRSPLKTLREASTMLWEVFRKKTRKLKGKDLQEAISGTWLEWTFGLQPLLFGTAEIASKLVTALDPTAQKYVPARAAVLRETSSTSERVYPVSPFGSAVLCAHVLETSGTIVRGGLWVNRFNNGRISRAAALGLNTIHHVTAQAWALMPLSFAVDWFVGVGPLLEECRPVAGNVISSWRSSSRYIQRDLQLTGVTDYLGSNRVPVFGKSTMYASELTRVVQIKPPGKIQLGPGLFNLSQGLSLAALAAAPMSALWKKTPWHSQTHPYQPGPQLQPPEEQPLLLRHLGLILPAV